MARGGNERVEEDYARDKARSAELTGSFTRCSCSRWKKNRNGIQRSTLRRSWVTSARAISPWHAGSRAQVSPYHCHPDATEIYFCFSGGGTMRTPTQSLAIVPGSFVVHPPGELHEYTNGAQRTLLFRVRYGADMH